MSRSKADPEAILTDQLAQCAAALAEVLAEARPRPGSDEIDEGQRRDAEFANAALLLKASARLGLALAKVRGEFNHTIRVSRGGPPGEI